jgi:16S rRNA (uracil1498-N3)-methyltransferase
MNYFFCPEILQTNHSITFSAEESHHAVKVLRVSPGDEINILNGKGQKAIGHIEAIINKQLKVLIDNVETSDAKWPLISIALAILKKKERLEWFVEKAVELGAGRLILFHSAHTEKSRVDEMRLQKLMITALKQSGNLWLPEIVVNQSFVDLIKQPFDGMKFIAHCEDGDKLLLKHAYVQEKSALILIGPEGDFSSNEIKSALDQKFAPVSLGDLRLRAETAALTALLTLKIANE